MSLIFPYGDTIPREGCLVCTTIILRVICAEQQALDTLNPSANRCFEFIPRSGRKGDSIDSTARGPSIEVAALVETRSVYAPPQPPTCPARVTKSLPHHLVRPLHP